MYLAGITPSDLLLSTRLYNPYLRTHLWYVTIYHCVHIFIYRYFS